MNRCVAIHANGTSEVLDIHPARHQELRGLGYRRFVVRTADDRSLSTAVYARGTPSSWQFAEAAKKVWGRRATSVQIFDEQGEPVTDALPAPATPLPMERTIAQTPRVDGQPTPATPMAAVDAVAPRHAPVTREMTADLRRAAHEIRLNLGDWLYGEGDLNERRAFADRLDAHVRALESLLDRK